MNSRRFTLKVLQGKFNRLNLYLGMQLDFYAIMDYFDKAEDIRIEKYPEGYRVKITSNDFFAKFVELENY